MGMNGMYQPGMIRPMMAPAGVRQPFGVNPNSPYKFNQQVRNAPQQQHQNQQMQQHQDVNQLANQFQNQAQISNQQQMQQQQQNNQQQMQQQNAEPELNAAILAAAEPSQQKQML